MFSRVLRLRNNLLRNGSKGLDCTTGSAAWQPYQRHRQGSAAMFSVKSYPRRLSPDVDTKGQQCACARFILQHAVKPCCLYQSSQVFRISPRQIMEDANLSKLAPWLFSCLQLSLSALVMFFLPHGVLREKPQHHPAALPVMSRTLCAPSRHHQTLAGRFFLWRSLCQCLTDSTTAHIRRSYQMFHVVFSQPLEWY